MTKEIKKGESWRRGYLQGYEEGKRESMMIVDKKTVDFLSTLEGGKLIEKIKYDLQHLPMGVSQWKNHGIKYSYWEYFKEQVRKEILEEIKKDV